MKKVYFLIIFSIPIILPVKSQDADTLLLHLPVSKYDTTIYKRIVYYKEKHALFHVKDYYGNGRIQMDAWYSSLDKQVKEELQCNYRSNTKEGSYRTWYKNGQSAYEGNYKDGLREDKSTSWYPNGIKESEKFWSGGRLNGICHYWTEEGDLQFDIEFRNGINLNPESVHYPYIDYLPPDYANDSSKSWPLIIFLHGGSARGSDTLDLYDYGPFDQIYKGRDFPFIILAPQCPEHIGWSTENWFENFYTEITEKYRIDTTRIYLTGASLGGSGTWYLAVKYPDRFTAIAPMSGFTRHMDFISDHIDRLKNLPVWAFHGKLDLVVPFEETSYLVDRIKKYNTKVNFTSYPDAGHWVHHLVYPGDDLYNWFLQHKR